jgi:single-strand DNA-binding protein
LVEERPGEGQNWRREMSVNKVILVGNLGGLPELKHTPGGKAVASFSIATSESWTDKEGKRENRTEWHKVVAWNQLAELCGKFLDKGSKVYLEGKLQTRSYDKDGITRYVTEVVAADIQFLSPKGAPSHDSDPTPETSSPPAPASSARRFPPSLNSNSHRPAAIEDDIPF